jgi:methylenetetrahydrofolate reductase (NADPH)
MGRRTAARPRRGGDLTQAALAEALQRPRYEVIPLDGITDRVLAHVPKDITVTVTASPTKGLDATLSLAETLTEAGYRAVPHISARLVRDRAHLDEVVDRLRGIREIFVIAGDAHTPAGDYAGAAALLEGMGDRRARFEAIGISGYPESHHLISDEETIAAMFAKEPFATHIISQLCFDADVIAGWIAAVRARGTLLPIWIGVPGSVERQHLLRISMKVGLGESVRFLSGHRGWLRRLALHRRYDPNRLLDALAGVLADPDARVAGVHVYTFNEVEETERWRRQLLTRLRSA